MFLATPVLLLLVLVVSSLVVLEGVVLEGDVLKVQMHDDAELEKKLLGIVTVVLAAC